MFYTSKYLLLQSFGYETTINTSVLMLFDLANILSATVGWISANILNRSGSLPLAAFKLITLVTLVMSTRSLSPLMDHYVHLEERMVQLCFGILTNPSTFTL